MLIPTGLVTTELKPSLLRSPQLAKACKQMSHGGVGFSPLKLPAAPMLREEKVCRSKAEEVFLGVRQGPGLSSKGLDYMETGRSKEKRELLWARPAVERCCK